MNQRTSLCRAALWLAVALGVAALAAAWVWLSARWPDPARTFSGPTMGSYYRVTVVRPVAAGDLAPLEREVQAIIERIDRLMSTWRRDSEISRINASDETDWQPVSRETAFVVGTAMEVGRLSGGAYDVTVGPLVNLWSFGPDKGHAGQTPGEEEIAAARQYVGLDLIEVRLDPPAVRKKRAQVYIDLSSIAPGYAVDRIADFLDRRGVHRYYVDVGGEVKARGLNPRNIPWQVAVEAPLGNQRSVQRIVGLTNLALATSGDYRSYFEENGVRYSHLIDPRTGFPVRHAATSVTVLDPSCARADALATALIVAGPEEGYSIAVGEGIPALFILGTGGVFTERWTPAFDRFRVK